MSFGFSIGDFVLLTQLANTTIQNARKACGAHDAITQEVKSLHTVLRGLEAEVSKPESILNKPGDNRTKELSRLARGCKKVLKVLSKVLDKYNALSDEKRSVTKLWQKVKFGNDEMLDMGEIRSQLTTYTQAITMFLNLMSIGSQGKVEQYMESHGNELREIKESLNWVTASMQANSHEEGSILTSYAEDDKVVWKSFRRELIKEGFSSRTLGKHRRTIIKYVLELGARGALDEIVEGEDGEEDQPAGIDETTDSSDESSETELQEDEEAGSEHSIDESTSSNSELISDPTHPATGVINVIETAAEPNIRPTSIGKSSPDQKTDPEIEDTREVSDPNVNDVDDLSNLHLIVSSESPAKDTKNPIEKRHRIEDAVDEDFIPEAHPNCYVDIEQCDQENTGVSINTFCDEQENIASMQGFSNHESSTPTRSPIDIDRSAHVATMLNSGQDGTEPATHEPFSASLFPVSRSQLDLGSSSESDSSSDPGLIRKLDGRGATVGSDDTRILSAREARRELLASGQPIQVFYTEILNYHENPPEENITVDTLRQHVNILKNSELSIRLAKASFIGSESEEDDDQPKASSVDSLERAEYEDPFPTKWFYASLTESILKRFRTEPEGRDGRTGSDGIKRCWDFRIFVSDGKELRALYRQDENLNYTEHEKRKQWRAMRRYMNHYYSPALEAATWSTPEIIHNDFYDARFDERYMRGREQIYC